MISDDWPENLRHEAKELLWTARMIGDAQTFQCHYEALKQLAARQSTTPP